MNGEPKPAPNWLLGIVSVGLVIALVGGAVLFAYVSNVSHDKDAAIVESLVQGCEVARGGTTALIENDIENLKTTDPRDFPDISPERFELLLSERLAELQELQKIVDPAGCDDTFRLP